MIIVVMTLREVGIEVVPIEPPVVIGEMVHKIPDSKLTACRFHLIEWHRSPKIRNPNVDQFLLQDIHLP